MCINPEPTTPASPRWASSDGRTTSTYAIKGDTGSLYRKTSPQVGPQLPQQRPRGGPPPHAGPRAGMSLKQPSGAGARFHLPRRGGPLQGYKGRQGRAGTEVQAPRPTQGRPGNTSRQPPSPHPARAQVESQGCIQHWQPLAQPCPPFCRLGVSNKTCGHKGQGMVGFRAAGLGCGCDAVLSTMDLFVVFVHYTYG